MTDESKRPPPARPARTSMRPANELDREPGSNRGHRGQMPASRKAARSSEENIQTMDGHDDAGKGDQSRK